MTSTLTKVLIFTAGLGVGSAVAWTYAKNKYEKEIESVKEVFSKREGELTSDLEEAREHLTHNAELDEEDNRAMMESFKETITRLGYTDYNGTKKEEEEMSNVDRPYVIAPDEYGEIDGYNTISLTYYEGDGVLADDFDDERIDIEDTVGYESLQHFGEYERDIVFVRNDSRRCDYEICLDERCYSDVNPEG